MRRSFRTFLVGAAISAACAWGAFAQEFPTRNVTLVSPYAAGGGNDFVTRTVARGLSEIFNKTVIVENRPGASGAIGLAYVARSKPDGHTLGIGGIGSVVLHPAIEGDHLQFDPQKELEPVAIIAKESPVLLVSKSLNVRNVEELIALGHKKQLTYGSPGVGSAMHLAGELFKQVTGIPMTHVPYKGQSAAFTDLLNGTISLVFTDVSVALPYAHDDRVRILAVAGLERAPKLPDVPTMAELGLPKMKMENWYAIYTARGTPPAVVQKLVEGLRAAMALPEVKKAITTTSGLIPIVEGPEGLKKQTAEDNDKWRPIAKIARGG